MRKKDIKVGMKVRVKNIKKPRNWNKICDGPWPGGKVFVVIEVCDWGDDFPVMLDGSDFIDIWFSPRELEPEGDVNGKRM